MLKRKKEIRKIDDREDYEKSGLKSFNKDVEKIGICATNTWRTRSNFCMPSNEETTKELVNAVPAMGTNLR